MSWAYYQHQHSTQTISVNQHNFLFFLSSWLLLFGSCSSLQFSFSNPPEFFFFLNHIRFNWIIPPQCNGGLQMSQGSALFSFLSYSSRLFLFLSKTLIFVCPITLDLLTGYVDRIGFVYSDQPWVIYVLLHFAWFVFYFHFLMHMGDGNKFLNLSIELIQVISLGVLLHVIFVSWLSWGAMLVVSHFIDLNWS